MSDDKQFPRGIMKTLLKVDQRKHCIKLKTCVAKTYYGSKEPFPILAHLKKKPKKPKTKTNKQKNHRDKFLRT